MRRAGILAIRIVLGGMFFAAGVSKVGEPLRTLASVYSYQIDVPDWAAWALAHGLPWGEILLGLALLAGVWLRVTAWCAQAVLGVFLVVTAQAWWRELPIDCGCVDMGALHPALAVLETPGGAALRNLVLMGLCGCLLRMARERNEAASRAIA